MVYEGRSTSRRRSRPGKNRGKRGGFLLKLALWALFLALGVRVFFPKTAENFKNKLVGLFGADYAQALRVFGQELGDGAGLTDAARQAVAAAFKTDQKGDIPVSADDKNGAQDTEKETENGSEGAEKTEDPEGEGDNDNPGGPGTGENAEGAGTGENTEKDPQTLDAVAVFQQEQAKITQESPPANVSFEKPELNLTLTVPVEGSVTSGFGYRDHPVDGELRFHYGVDIGAQAGEAVRACAPGTVTAVGESTTYGLYVILRHQGGAESIYAHLSKISVTGGQALEAGETLGLVGDSGNATSPCLHWELIVGGNYVNPEFYLDISN